MQRRGCVALALAAALGAACQWVPLTTEGEGVRVANAAEVEGCKQLGTVSGKTTVTVGPMARNEAKVASEVEALARNEAATMGANAIVPTGALEWDQRSYAAFRCEAK
ncbi:MAG TPA: DUF4156 domain-containing protein [Myxococcota bacterium]|jgi:hypothetical protein